MLSLHLQVILQSVGEKDVSGDYSSKVAFGRWCLRRSVAIKRLIVGPGDVVSLLSDAKVMQNLTNAKEVEFMFINYRDGISWPAEIGLLFNAMSNKQTLSLHLVLYKADVFLEQTAVKISTQLSKMLKTLPILCKMSGFFPSSLVSVA